ncbi:MAG TPA: potassium-transporting ATPase subunit KdpA, partial [Gemmatimonadaceae bacterium]|nr:potassium-transporting ATPase subunit KdpA [Gemmatimonadaceae bacterium]
MTVIGWMQIAFYAALLLAITKPLGWYLLRVYDGSMHWLSWIERPLYRLGGVDPTDDQHWTRYAASLLLFSAAGMLLTYFVLRLQALLPLNPQHLAGVTARQAFETSASFATNTNWQSYAGETTMSYLAQATQLTFHNFVSAAAGMAAAIALTRGIARHGGEARGRLGNFWADLVRGTLYVLLPLSLVVALVLVQQGVIQNLAPYRVVTTLEGARQTIAMGPAASQIAIKQVGTNGGGFFNANSSHPFENPTPWSDFVEMFLILAIPSALTWTFGRMVKRQAHGWALWAAMFAIFAGGVSATYWAEARGNPIQAAAGVDVRPSAGNPGGNMEGKEVRFGIANAALWAVATTDASSGSVNAMHDSFTPLGGLVPLVNIQLGEEIFGGVGSGLYGMIMMAILTVFIAGLMVGRTPEYLGKKIQAREVQMVMLYALVLPAAILVPSAVSVLVKPGLAGLTNTGPHGLSEILYAFTSTVGNNGSAFAGLNGSSYYYNTLFGFAMLVGRFAMMVPVLAVGGFLAGRKPAPESAGTFP